MPKFPTTAKTLELRYAQVEELVAGLLDVHPDRRKTLGARIRLFRTRGFPPVTAISKARFSYELDAVLRMSLAFSMIDAFIPQEIVPAIIERDWKELNLAFAKAFALIEEKGNDAAAIDGERPMLVILPRNLHAFTLDATGTADPGRMVSLDISTAAAVSMLARNGGSADEFAPTTILDIHRLAGWVRNAILQARWAGPEVFSDYAAR